MLNLYCFRPLAGVNYNLKTRTEPLLTRLSSFRPLAGVNYNHD